MIHLSTKSSNTSFYTKILYTSKNLLSSFTRIYIFLKNNLRLLLVKSIKPLKKNNFKRSFISILEKKCGKRSRRLNKFSNLHYLEILPLKSLMHEFINIASSLTQVGGWIYLPIFSKLPATRGKLNFCLQTNKCVDR